MENIQENTYYSEEEVREAFVLRAAPRLLRVVFGEENITRLIEILNSPLIEDLDILHMTGEIPYSAIAEYERSSDEYQDLLIELNALADQMIEKYLTDKDRIRGWVEKSEVVVLLDRLTFEYSYFFSRKTRKKDTPMAYFDLHTQFADWLKVNCLPKSVSINLREQFLSAIAFHFISKFYNYLNERVIKDYGIGKASFEDCRSLFLAYWHYLKLKSERIAEVMVAFLEIRTAVGRGNLEQYSRLIKEIVDTENEEVDFSDVQSEALWKNVSHCTKQFKNGRIDLAFDELGSKCEQFSGVVAMGVLGFHESCTIEPAVTPWGDEGLTFGTVKGEAVQFTVSRSDGELYFFTNSARLDTIFTPLAYEQIKKVVHKMIYDNLVSSDAKYTPYNYEIQGGSMVKSDEVRGNIKAVMSPSTEATTYEYTPYVEPNVVEDSEESLVIAENTSGKKLSVTSYRDCKRVRRAVESFCGAPIRSGKHLVFRAPSGVNILLPNSAKGNKKDISHGIVLNAIKQLGITLEEFAEHY